MISEFIKIIFSKKRNSYITNDYSDFSRLAKSKEKKKKIKIAIMEANKLQQNISIY
ncbi:hypothetical protein H6792_00685 [Candidatus Nomurabacteria bacterium]|nr:hypothetical protein [Candidatus Nomurabacteria bacterium]